LVNVSSPLACAPFATPAKRRKWLQAETASLHSQLDRSLVAAGHFDSGERIAVYLQRLHMLYDSIERLFDRGNCGAILYDWHSRRKSPLILRDLAHLDTLPLPSRAQLAHLDHLTARSPDAAAILGTAYVTEGSLLGAMQLSTLIAKQGLGPDTGGAFFCFARTNAPALWKAFLPQLETAVLSPEQEFRLIEAAQETFQAFESVLCAQVESSRS